LNDIKDELIADILVGNSSPVSSSWLPDLMDFFFFLSESCQIFQGVREARSGQTLWCTPVWSTGLWQNTPGQSRCQPGWFEFHFGQRSRTAQHGEA
jgi:hypothetical protein